MCCSLRTCHACSHLKFQRSLLTHAVWLLVFAAVAAEEDQQVTETVQPTIAGPSVPHQKHQHPHASIQQTAAGDMRPSLAASAVTEEPMALYYVDRTCAVPDLSDVLMQPRQSTAQRISSSDSYASAAPPHDHEGRGMHNTDETASIDNRTIITSSDASVPETAGQGPEDTDSVDHHNWAAAKAGGKILAANQEVQALLSLTPHQISFFRLDCASRHASDGVPKRMAFIRILTACAATYKS